MQDERELKQLTLYLLLPKGSQVIFLRTFFIANESSDFGLCSVRMITALLPIRKGSIKTIIVLLISEKTSNFVP